MRAIIIAAFGAILGAGLVIGATTQAQPRRPSITSVSHLAVYAADPA